MVPSLNDFETHNTRTQKTHASESRSSPKTATNTRFSAPGVIVCVHQVHFGLKTVVMQIMNLIRPLISSKQHAIFDVLRF